MTASRADRRIGFEPVGLRKVARCSALRRGWSLLDMAVARSNEVRYHMTSFMTR